MSVAREPQGTLGAAPLTKGFGGDRQAKLVAAVLQKRRPGRKGHSERSDTGSLRGTPLSKEGSCRSSKKTARSSSDDRAFEERRLPTLPTGRSVPSALVRLTSLFGMDRGGSTLLKPPQYISERHSAVKNSGENSSPKDFGLLVLVD